MEELLPFYERELGFLRRHAREFAERYPKIAGRLQMAGEVCEDPHIERMIQSFALLNARISKRLDDDYPQFTEALFDVLYPHYLRIFPSCSIARMDADGAAAQLAGLNLTERGTEFETLPVRGGPCRFRTVYPVTLAPLAVSQVRFDAILRSPEALRAPAGASSGISITLSATTADGNMGKIANDKLRVFIDGEPSFCAALRDALFTRTVAAYVEGDASGRWTALNATPISPAGFAEDEAVVDFPARSHPAYRLLTEYFCFPEKFNFFDIDLDALRAPLSTGCRSITLHLALSGMRSDSNVARMLATLGPNNLLLGCTPVVNLFSAKGDPIRVNHTTASYTVLAEARRAHGHAVHSIDSVHMVRESAKGQKVVEFRPFYSLHHGQAPEQSGHYWVLRHDDGVARQSPGHGAQLTIVDIDFNPTVVEQQSLSLQLTCSNGDLPQLLNYGQPQGDLFMGANSKFGKVSLLRKPSAPLSFERGAGAHWRLISHLSLNHLSLTDGGIDAFREMLTLYDLARSPSSQRQIGGISAVTHRPASAWLPGNPFACLVRGIEVRLCIDEEAFVGTGIHAFAHVIERFLGLYVHANSYTQLVIVSNKNGEELLKLPPRSGELSLL